MDNFLESDSIQIFILLVVPGLISMHVWRLLIATPQVEWASAALEAAFYGALNFALTLPLIILIHQDGFPQRHPYIYAGLGLVVLFVAPIVWPLLLKLLLNTPVMRGLQLPYPTAWDFFFEQRLPVFVLITLQNGRMIGGLFGPESYAASYPRDGDIYLECMYHVNSNGVFGQPVAGSRGVLVRKEEYSHIELLEIPPTAEEGERDHG